MASTAPWEISAWCDANGERVINRDALYDFGPALVGERKALTMTVLNSGVGKLTLTTLEQTEGAEVAIGRAGTDTSAFEVDCAGVDRQLAFTLDRDRIPCGSNAPAP